MTTVTSDVQPNITDVCTQWGQHRLSRHGLLGPRWRRVRHVDDKDALLRARTRLYTQSGTRSYRKSGALRSRSVPAIPGARREAIVAGAGSPEGLLRSPRPVSGHYRGLLGCPRARKLTFTKLSASGKPGSTISSSGLVALVAGAACCSRGLGGAIFPS